MEYKKYAKINFLFPARSQSHQILAHALAMKLVNLQTKCHCRHAYRRNVLEFHTLIQ